MTTVVVASAIRDLHEGWGWFVTIGNGLAGAWALAAHRWTALRHRSLWLFTATVQGAIVVQAVIGVALLSEIEGDPPDVHLFYGFLGIIGVALLFSYRQQLAGRVHLLYGFGGLFLMGLAIRSMVLGS